MSRSNSASRVDLEVDPSTEDYLFISGASWIEECINDLRTVAVRQGNSVIARQVSESAHLIQRIIVARSFAG
ncbi:hypothetical protein TNCV_80151 [Trichonephila clavipes]|nr:hypothetical protein TNCV_80151 [Trichonephila clavipes]